MSAWKTGTPAQLVAELRIGGWLQGHSALLPRYVRLHKTDLIADLRRMKPDTTLIWMVKGDPGQTGAHAKDRRTVVVWLGK